jgi:hypothetical protein
MFGKLFARLLNKQPEGEMEARAREVADQKARELGYDPNAYTVRIERDAVSWRVMYLPNERGVRGGGFEIILNKKSYQVQDVRYYQ